MASAIAGCKKTPLEAANAECNKRVEGTPDLEKRLELAKSCLDVYTRETFGRDREYSPLKRLADNSAEPENLHFGTVLGEIQSICGDISAKASHSRDCKVLCKSVADYRMLYAHFLVDNDESTSASIYDLRKLCLSDFGVDIPKPKSASAPSKTPLAE